MLRLKNSEILSPVEKEELLTIIKTGKSPARDI